LLLDRGLPEEREQFLSSFLHPLFYDLRQIRGGSQGGLISPSFDCLMSWTTV